MGAKRLVICFLVGWLLLQGPVAPSAGQALTPGPSPNPGRGEQDEGLPSPGIGRGVGGEGLPSPGIGRGVGGEGLPHLQADARNVELVGQIGGTCQAVAVQGRYAYIGLGPRLAVVDISNPARPALVGQSTILPDGVSDVVVSGRRAYAAAVDAGLRVLDISDPAHPHEVGAYDTPQSAWGVAISGTLAYVAASVAGLRVVDVSDPAHPRELGYYAPQGMPRAWLSREPWPTSLIGISAYG